MRIVLGPFIRSIRQHQSIKKRFVETTASYKGFIIALIGQKKTGAVTRIVNVEFETPAKGGQKSAALLKCKVVQKSYNTGWKKYKKEDAGTE